MCLCSYVDTSGNTNTVSESFSSLYTNSYKAIRIANTVIQRAGNITMSEETRNELIGKVFW